MISKYQKFGAVTENFVKIFINEKESWFILHETFFRCNYANYCCESCLEEDIPIHEAECHYFARRRAGGPTGDTCRLILRIILAMRSSQANRICDIVPGQKGSIKIFLGYHFIRLMTSLTPYNIY